MSDYCPSCMAENADGAEKCSVCGGDMRAQNRQHQLPAMTILEGRYLIGKVLGEGGFGITYIGLDLRLEERVAIKEFYPAGSVARYATHSQSVEATSAEGEMMLEREREKFLTEARTMSRFSGESSIVRVKDFFYANSTAYIVMEYIDGETMQRRLKENGPEKDFNKLLDMLRPVMKDLDVVHKAGFIHRDISPSNLMMDKSGSIKLLDFGTAREVSEDGEKSLSIVLKPGYAPEEQYRRHGQQGAWTDVYALCATMYKLCTGVTPEVSVDRLAVDTLEPPSKLGVKITPQQEAVLMRGLAVHQEERIQSTAELLEELDKAAEGKAVFEPENGDKVKADKKEKAGKLKKGRIVLAVIAAVITVGLTVVFATGAAQNFIGYTYDFNGNGTEAAKWYKLAAEQGNLDAQYNLGWCYETGNGVEQSYEEAVKWYRLAAEQDDPNGQFSLGWCYENGNGVEQSYKEAVKWYQLAAEQGYPDAQNNLGVCYENGYGIEQSYEEAVKWYQLAAEQGEPYGQNNLGRCYENGNGVEQSYEEAVKWYKLAAEQGQPNALINLASCYLYGNGVEQSYEEAVKWFKLAAEQGNTYAQANLGVFYEHGDGVEQSYEEAVKWYRLAAEQWDADGQTKLGICYEYGIGVEQSYEEAVKWYRLASEQGYPDAQINLGVCYYFGNGTEQSYEEAVKWFKLAAEQGNPKAQANLGICYEYGDGVEQSYEEAVKWYKLAAEQGYPGAQKNLGVCYEYGTGVDQSYEEAAKWYRLAAEQGDSYAQNNLGVCYEYGNGVEQSYEEAVKWYKLAAEQGDMYGQFNLGWSYEYGNGIEQSYKEAAKWYQMAADNGHEGAQNRLEWLKSSGAI